MHISGCPVPERKKEGLGEGKTMGCTGSMAPHHRRPIYHGGPTRTTTGACGSDGIRVMHADDENGGVGSRELATPAVCGISSLDVDKVGFADSLTGAVIAMVIIVIERIKRPRRKKVDGGQLKWAAGKMSVAGGSGGGKSRAGLKRL